MPTSSRSPSSRQTTPYSGPSPYFPSRSYAPTLTPRYDNMTPAHYSPSQTNKTPKSAATSSSSPQPGPSRTPDHNNRQQDDNFSRPPDPPGYSSPLYAPLYSPAPGDTPTYSGYTPFQSGLTPGYSGPSPEGGAAVRSTVSPEGHRHSPVYSGPPPGLISNASTPGHPPDVEPGYTPIYSGYTPSNPGTPASPPVYSPGEFSPGNATPKGGTTPSPAAAAAATAGGGASPQIQQPEVSGNTTPHPGPSGASPGGERNPRYLW